MDASRIRIYRHDSALAQWELAFAAPDRSLRRYVREYVGWNERVAQPMQRRETPSADIPVIINFGPGLRERHSSAREWTHLRSFVAGLHDSFSIVEGDGPGHGIQMNFTAIGASLFLNRPLQDLYNRAVGLEDVLGPAAGRLELQLYEAPTWEARFKVLDRVILTRIAAASPVAPEIAWAWSRLIDSGGRAPISAIVRQTSWSERHFIGQMRAQFGMSPKLIGRMIRFGRAVRRIGRGHTGRLTDLAQECGYYDQSHFVRDFQAFAGVSPSELLASRLPDSGFIIK